MTQPLRPIVSRAQLNRWYVLQQMSRLLLMVLRAAHKEFVLFLIMQLQLIRLQEEQRYRESVLIVAQQVTQSLVTDLSLEARQMSHQQRIQLVQHLQQDRREV
jgi:hypothetical protein